MAGAGQAERNLKGRPSALFPLQGAGGASVRDRWRSLYTRYVEQCKWDAAAQDLPTEFLDSKNGLLGVQQLVRRKGDDACHADMLSSFDLDTTKGQRDAARLCASSRGPTPGTQLLLESRYLTTVSSLPKTGRDLSPTLLSLCGTAWGATFPLT